MYGHKMMFPLHHTCTALEIAILFINGIKNVWQDYCKAPPYKTLERGESVLKCLFIKITLYTLLKNLVTLFLILETTFRKICQLETSLAIQSLLKFYAKIYKIN